MEQAYDASGNTLYDGNNEYWYDAEGQLCAVQSQRWPGAAIIQYIYDAEGARIGKGTLASAPGSYTATCAPPFGSGFTLTNRYLVDLGGEQVTELNGSGVWQHSNVWAGGKLVATYDTKGIHFELTDPLGTKRVQANAQGQVDETCTSLPFGNEVGNSPGANCVQPGNQLGTGDDATEHHFTQKERDTETGNDYFLARYYSSALGRFMSPDWSAKEDPVPYAHSDDSQSLNLYAYVLNNPLAKADLDGHGCPPDCSTGNDVVDFFNGLGNAWASDNTLGLGRNNQSSGAGQLGQAFGDFGAAAQGAGEAVLGSGGEVVGVALDATGVGAVVGVPANIVSAGVIAHGATSATVAATHLAKDASQSSTGTGTTKPSSAGKMQKEVEKGQAPSSVDRVDKGRGPHEQDHVHFNDGSARNQDGTWKHGISDLSKKVTDWLGKHGWN